MKIGVIGLGSIGTRHAENLRSLGHWVNGYDISLGKRLACNGVLYEAKELIELSDAIVIASPTTNHLQHILDTLHNDKPVFVEKPIADTHVIPGWLTNIKMVGYNLRFHACVKKVKEWVKLIGKPLWANFTVAQFNNKPAYLRDGVVLNWSHEIDLALHLLGPAYVEASSVRIVDGADDLADILLTHENGCRSTIHLDYLTKPEQRTFIIQGDKGKIMVRVPQREIIFQAEDNNLVEFLDGSYDQDYKDEMQAFIDRIEGKDAPGCTAEEAVQVLNICLEVRRNAGL